MNPTKYVAIFLAGAVLLAGCNTIDSNPKPYFYCSFAQGQWDPNDWIMVKSPRWEHFGQWIQHDEYIQNETPIDATAEDMISRRAAETYTSMVLKQKFNPNMTVQATMAFAR